MSGCHAPSYKDSNRIVFRDAGLMLFLYRVIGVVVVGLFLKRQRRQSRWTDGAAASWAVDCEGLHRGQRQQFLHLTVSQHDVGCALQRLKITPFISIAKF